MPFLSRSISSPFKSLSYTARHIATSKTKPSTILTTNLVSNRSSSFSTTTTATSANTKQPRTTTEDLVFDPKMFDSKTKVRMLREMMVNRRLDAYIIPNEDDHASEYLSPHDQRRIYFTHFLGSTGIACVTATQALLWTDGRYWNQAEKELDLVAEESGVGGGEGQRRTGTWTLMKSGKPDVPNLGTWLARALGDGDETLEPSTSVLRIGIDPRLLSYSGYKRMIKKFEEYQNNEEGLIEREIIPLADNLIDEIWKEDKSEEGISCRPARNISTIFIHPEKYAGQDFPKKLSTIREGLLKSGSEGIVITALDELCWLFNLRAGDIPFNPVFFGYAILTAEECTLFVRPEAMTKEVRDYLARGGVAAVAYEEVWSALKRWGKTITDQRVAREEGKGTQLDARSGKKDKWVYNEQEAKQMSGESVKGKVMIGNGASWGVVQALGEENVAVKRSLVEDAKAIKNATEIEGFRQCHVVDGAALCRYFAWLEELLESGETINEHDAATQLEKFRSHGPLFKGLSFPTISSIGPNAAVIHYHPPSEGSATIDRSSMYLCDSGAQYLTGTTDTTRTLHFGTPTPEEKHDFTLVLRGHIAIDTAIFPKNTTGHHLDVLARGPLWSQGLDYRHGTGHGVGSFLNVHEGPQGIGAHEVCLEVPLKEGMVISNEPGYYADGKHGIRIENLVVVRRADTPSNFQETGFMEMEHLTMCPIQTRLVEPSMLSPAERNWLDGYNAEVKAKLWKILEGYGDERALRWLERECEPLNIEN